jgi:hypothetical protein
VIFADTRINDGTVSRFAVASLNSSLLSLQIDAFRDSKNLLTFAYHKLIWFIHKWLGLELLLAFTSLIRAATLHDMQPIPTSRTILDVFSLVVEVTC